MRKFLLATMLGGLTIWTSCTNEDLTQGMEPDQPYVLKVTVENAEADTRTQIGENGSVTWTEGDQIGVFVEGETSPVPFTFSGMSGNVASRSFA